MFPSRIASWFALCWFVIPPVGMIVSLRHRDKLNSTQNTFCSSFFLFIWHFLLVVQKDGDIEVRDSQPDLV